MIKLIHAADLHMDTPMEALGTRAALRRAELRTLPGRIAETVRRRGADVLLLAGDLLNGLRACPETVAALKSALAGLDCPVFIVPGNHDPFTAGSVYAREKFSDNVHIFHGDMSCVELPGLGLAVWGSDSPAPLRDFVCPDNGYINVFLWHGDVDKDAGYGCISRTEVADSAFDYAALGHVHACSGLQRSGGTHWAYPGCTEGRGFDECGDKGLLYLELDGSSVSAEFIPLALRRYEVLELDISEGVPSPPAGHERDICRVIFSGETDFAPALEAIQESWEPEFFALQLRDATRLRRDIWEGSARDSLRGLFLRKMLKKYESAPSEAEREKIILAVRMGLASLDGGEAVHKS